MGHILEGSQPRQLTSGSAITISIFFSARTANSANRLLMTNSPGLSSGSMVMFDMVAAWCFSQERGVTEEGARRLFTLLLLLTAVGAAKKPEDRDQEAYWLNQVQTAIWVQDHSRRFNWTHEIHISRGGKVFFRFPLNDILMQRHALKRYNAQRRRFTGLQCWHLSPGVATFSTFKSCWQLFRKAFSKKCCNLAQPA